MKVQTILNLFKRQAKKLAKSQQLQHSVALDLLAKRNGFQHWHEAQAVAKNSPLDSRLVSAVFGTNDLSEAIYEDPVYADFEELLDEHMLVATTDTNAEAFCIDDSSFSYVDFDASTRVLILAAEITYSGEQIPDRMYTGTSFNLDARVRLFWSGSKWELAEEDALEVVSGISDQELDWQQQAEQGTL